MVVGISLLPIALAIFIVLALSFLLHFLKLFSSFVKPEGPSNIPNGSMGWPFIGETLGYLIPHKSNSMGSYLESHCSRYLMITIFNKFLFLYVVTLYSSSRSGILCPQKNCHVSQCTFSQTMQQSFFFLLAYSLFQVSSLFLELPPRCTLCRV